VVQGIVISGNHVNRTGHLLHPASDLGNKGATHPIVFESVARDEQEFGPLTVTDICDPLDRFEPGHPHPVSGFTHMRGGHSDLPVGRMYKSHNPILRGQVAHRMS
jgi:hypothetical protein